MSCVLFPDLSVSLRQWRCEVVPRILALPWRLLSNARDMLTAYCYFVTVTQALNATSGAHLRE